MIDYRHVCFKDLENYFKRSDYFGNLSESEKSQIRKNLNLPTTNDLKDRENGFVEDTYENIKKLVDNNQLSLNNIYIINDFQSIYRSNKGNVFGLNNFPSKVYSLVLKPISSNQFSKDVQIIENGIAKDWIVRYNFDQKDLDGIKTKGEIIYMQDQNNNSAYYDFKNIRYTVHLDSSDLSVLQNGGDYVVYTFNKFENGEFVDNSDSVNVMNNTFDQNCFTNVFLGETCNNHFYGGFKENIFTQSCKNNKFEWNTFGNKFTGNVNCTQGSIQNAKVTTTVFESAISKEFKTIHTLETSDPVFVVTYLDGETLTTQVIKLNKRDE